MGPVPPPFDAVMQQWLQALVDEHTDYLSVVDAKGRTVFANRGLTRLFGWEPSEVVGKADLGLVHPDDRQRVASSLGQALAQPGRRLSAEFRLRCKDGTYRMVESAGVNLLNDPRINGILATTRDITDRKLAEMEVARQREDIDRQLHHARILHQISEDIASTDEPRAMLDALVRTLGEGLALDRCLILDIGRTRGVASGVCEWLNAASPDAFSVLRDYPLSIFPRSDESMWTTRKAIISHADEPAPPLVEEGSVGFIHQEIKISSLIWFPFGFRTDGYYMLCINQATVRRDWRLDEVVFVESAATHASLALQKRRILGERLMAEEQLRQSQKMEAIGRLAGGIAHDFNNLLTAIIGYADLLRSKLPTEDPLRQYVDGILQVSNRAASTTHQLLSFSRRQVLKPKLLDLNAVVSQSEELLSRLIGENIELLVDFGADAGRVRVDPGQLELALVNLAVNARDAMPEGGRLRMETSRCALDQPLAGTLHLTPGDYARIVVRDDGVGMERETLSHLFEPFFTTKELGKGTGLGLSSVYGIVRAAGGGIDVASSPGQGSAFSIYLPREDAGQSTPSSGAQVKPSPGGSESVLMVEDDDVLRELLSEALREHGFQVLTARDGAQALAIAKAAPTIHLVLSDVVMPHMNGPVLARALTKIHPQARLLFMSGYTADAFAGQSDLAHVPMLAKPFSINALISAVRSTLDGRPTQKSPASDRRRS